MRLTCRAKLRAEVFFCEFGLFATRHEAFDEPVDRVVTHVSDFFQDLCGGCGRLALHIFGNERELGLGMFKQVCKIGSVLFFSKRELRTGTGDVQAHVCIHMCIFSHS